MMDADDTLITTERLRLVRPAEKDLALFKRLFGDEAMMCRLGGTWDNELIVSTLEEWQREWGLDYRWYGTVLMKDTGEAVGAAGLMKDTVEGEEGYELSWFILPEHQRKGYAAEITRGLLDFAFSLPGNPRVLAETHPDNPGANGLLRREGFICLGERNVQYDFLPNFERQVLWVMDNPGHNASGT